jgi:hypothetical protein
MSASQHAQASAFACQHAALGFAKRLVRKEGAVRLLGAPAKASAGKQSRKAQLGKSWAAYKLTAESEGRRPERADKLLFRLLFDDLLQRLRAEADGDADDGELGDLGRLDRDRTKEKPAGRAADRRTGDGQ